MAELFSMIGIAAGDAEEDIQERDILSLHIRCQLGAWHALVGNLVFFLSFFIYVLIPTYQPPNHVSQSKLLTPSSRLFGSRRILPLLPALLSSPVLLDLHWSPLVHGAAQRNLRAWGWIPHSRASATPNSKRSWFPSLSRPNSADTTADAARRDAGDAQKADTAPDADTHAPLPRVLALHLRRGDYEQHCLHLAANNGEWLGINEVEGLGDRWVFIFRFFPFVSHTLSYWSIFLCFRPFLFSLRLSVPFLSFP